MVMNKSSYLFRFTQPIRTKSSFLGQDPLEAILAIFGRKALIFFCLKALGKK